MNNQLFILFTIGILLSGMLIGFPIGKGCKTCPEIKIGKETISITVVQHDTVEVPVMRDSIKVKEKIKYITKYVVLDDTQAVVFPDTTICYDFDKNMEDGAYIKAEICSDSLPKTKPLDLTGNFWYKAPPDTNMEIIRIDTVTYYKKLPAGKDWKTYALIITATVAGMFIVKEVRK